MSRYLILLYIVSIEIPEMDCESVEKELKKIYSKKVVGIDGLSCNLLKISAPVIAQSITMILNCSIRTGIFPDAWKAAKVVPIHKGGSLTQLGNFRPVSVLCSLSKLIERHIHNCFYEYLTSHQLLQEAQSDLGVTTHVSQP